MKYVILVLLLPATALGSAISIGPLGIDAVGLRGPNGEVLDGMGVKIGQVEATRPADPDKDTGAFPNSSINPTQVWVQQINPGANDIGQTTQTEFFDLSHATFVAEVMTSTHATGKGVATAAAVYADAYKTLGANEVEPLLSIQHIINAGGFTEGRPINNSWDKEFSGGDGLSPLTLGFDWMATRYNALLVATVNDDVRPDDDSPSDNYNGITVAASERIGAGAYRKAWANSDIDVYFRKRPLRN